MLFNSNHGPANFGGYTDEPLQTDLRHLWVGSERAAAEIGVSRSQVWRLASKWYESQGDLPEAGPNIREPEGQPKVRVVILGTEARREYKYWLPDVLRYAQARRAAKALRKIKARKAQQGLRRLQATLALQRLTMADVVAAFRQGHPHQGVEGR